MTQITRKQAALKLQVQLRGKNAERPEYIDLCPFEKNRVFEALQISIKMTSMERSSKTGEENGIVCHVSTNISWDRDDQISKNMRKLLIQQNIFDLIM